MSAGRIIVVEDDDALRDVVCDFLRKAGFAVRACADSETLHATFAAEPADVVVLDINLPGENGFAAAGRLRARSSVGIVMLTARVDQDARVLGLTSGADAYLTKPLHLRELQATVTNLLWRVRSQGTTQPPEPPAQPWTLDRRGWALISPCGKRVELSATEFRLVALLAAEPGRPISRDEILAGLGKAATTNDGRSVDIVLSRLRKKVSDITGQPLPVKSVRASGYTFSVIIADAQ